MYDELHTLASRYLSRERRDHTLQATALVNEAYLKLAGQREVDWQNRAHFFGIAAQLMRRILVDHARGGTAGSSAAAARRTCRSTTSIPPAPPPPIDAVDAYALDRRSRASRPSTRSRAASSSCASSAA